MSIIIDDTTAIANSDLSANPSVNDIKISEESISSQPIDKPSVPSLIKPKWNYGPLEQQNYEQIEIQTPPPTPTNNNTDFLEHPHVQCRFPPVKKTDINDLDIKVFEQGTLIQQLMDSNKELRVEVLQNRALFNQHKIECDNSNEQMVRQQNDIQQILNNHDAKNEAKYKELITNMLSRHEERISKMLSRYETLNKIVHDKIDYLSTYIESEILSLKKNDFISKTNIDRLEEKITNFKNFSETGISDVDNRLTKCKEVLHGLISDLKRENDYNNNNKTNQRPKSYQYSK
jgi:hypothetical protein